MIAKVQLIKIDQKWIDAKRANAKRMRRTRIFMSENSPRYEALRRVDLALKTVDPLAELEGLYNDVVYFVAFGDIEMLYDLQAFILQEEVYAQAIQDLS